ncbi:MAG: putative ABC transporter permease, partial [Bacilli bacterium]|nr:putative ABC transporter permease [Bacilli bacterium]
MGWFLECIFCTIDDKKLVYDRGFLLGPYCPIYGCGALYMYFFLDKYQSDPLALFIMAMVGTSILEYVTSFLMEKIFRARWWDYSNR